jgi:hypothetical protein
VERAVFWLPEKTGLEASILSIALMTDEKVNLAFELRLPLVELRDLGPEYGELSVALALLLFDQLVDLLAGVLCLLLHLIRRGRTDLPFCHPVEPFVHVIDRLPNLVFVNDARNHVAQLRGEEVRCQDAEAEKQALGHDHFLPRAHHELVAQVPEGRNELRATMGFLFGILGLHVFSKEIVKARALLAFPGKDLLVVVLVLEIGFRIFLDLDDGRKSVLGGIDLFALFGYRFFF